MKVALVYDRVNKWGGAERILLTLHKMFPDAPLYTAVYNSKTALWASVFPRIYTSFLQNIPFAKTWHEGFGWLMPLAFESFNFDGYDLVISVTSEAAKGIIVRPPTRHICYLLTPTRYLWSAYEIYFRNPIMNLLSKPIVKYLRRWDVIAARRPDRIISISGEVERRVRKYYNRDSKVIFPPVDLKVLQVSQAPREYFLVVSRLVPYKRIEVAVEAFNELGIPLVVVGTGSQEMRLRRMAKTNIKFVKNLTDEELSNYYLGAKALIMPQEEDFGLAAVEAQACGCPVIAFGKGGALDTVVDPSAGSGCGTTGIFFEKQSANCLVDAVKRFDRMKFNLSDLVSNAEKFSNERFKKEFNIIMKGI